jgi:hypothetical protein
MLERNVHRFRRYASAQGVDATYRILRSTLRLAVAYGCRGVGQPFRRPFASDPALDGDGLDLRHARHLLDHVVQRVEAADDRLRLGTLYRDALLSANLFAERRRRLARPGAARAASLGYPYQRAQGTRTRRSARCVPATPRPPRPTCGPAALAASTLHGAAPGPDGRPSAATSSWRPG